MNRTEHEHELMRRYLEGVASLEETQELESLIVKDAGVRQDFLRYMHLDSALAGVRRSQPSVAASSRSVWLSWRPLTAAAAGIVFGMLCTSVVFGFVNQRAAVKKVPLLDFDAGLEDVTQTLKDGLPDRVGHWGMDEASIVAAEQNVLPLQGERMLRLEPIPPQKPVKNHTSRAYLMLDLRSQPVAMMNGEAEAEVTASFFATNSDLSSRYLIRAIALDEEPETATKNFWSKVESDGVVSESQRFDTLPGKSGWHTFSMKLRLPPGSKTLVLIFGAVPPEDTSRPALVHYLDDVQVSLLTPQPLL